MQHVSMTEGTLHHSGCALMGEGTCSFWRAVRELSGNIGGLGSGVSYGGSWLIVSRLDLMAYTARSLLLMYPGGMSRCHKSGALMLKQTKTNKNYYYQRCT